MYGLIDSDLSTLICYDNSKDNHVEILCSQVYKSTLLQHYLPSIIIIIIIINIYWVVFKQFTVVPAFYLF